MRTTALGAEHARKKRFDQGVIEKIRLHRFKPSVLQPLK
jgi:hypothetical protein